MGVREGVVSSSVPLQSNVLMGIREGVVAVECIVAVEFVIVVEYDSVRSSIRCVRVFSSRV